MKTAAIIPAYNESKTIDNVVRGALEHVSVVIVVDDGSVDNTGEIAKSAGAAVVRNTTGKGYEAAINKGFKLASLLDVDIAVTMDADGQHDPRLLPKFVSPIKRGEAHLVIGIRPNKARFGELIFGLYTQLRFGIQDILCGMKSYSMELYRKHGCFDQTNSIGTELALWAVRSGYPFSLVEIPIEPRADLPRFGIPLLANTKILAALARTILSNIL